MSNNPIYKAIQEAAKQSQEEMLKTYKPNFCPSCGVTYSHQKPERLITFKEDGSVPINDIILFLRENKADKLADRLTERANEATREFEGQRNLLSTKVVTWTDESQFNNEKKIKSIWRWWK